jgi:hypothetical protein
MVFEKFIPGRQHGRLAPKISVRTRNARVNAAAVRGYGLGSYQYAVLYYDADATLIAFNPVKEKEDHAVRSSSKPVDAKEFNIKSLLMAKDIRIGKSILRDLLPVPDMPGFYYFKVNEETP